MTRYRTETCRNSYDRKHSLAFGAASSEALLAEAGSADSGCAGTFHQAGKDRALAPVGSNDIVALWCAETHEGCGKRSRDNDRGGGTTLGTNLCEAPPDGYTCCSPSVSLATTAVLIRSWFDRSRTSRDRHGRKRLPFLSYNIAGLRQCRNITSPRSSRSTFSTLGRAGTIQPYRGVVSMNAAIR